MPYRRTTAFQDQTTVELAYDHLQGNAARPILHSLREMQELPAASPTVEERDMYSGRRRHPHERTAQKPIFFIKDVKGLVRFDPRDILYLQADGNYVEVHLHCRRAVLRNSLAEVLKLLPKGILAQVNRAQAVNILRLDLITLDEVRLGEMGFTLSRHFRDNLLGCLHVITGR